MSEALSDHQQFVGAITTAWAAVFYYFVPNTPTETRWLTRRQKLVVIHRISTNKIGIKDKKIKPYQIKEALRDPKLWLLCAFQITNGICKYSGFAATQSPWLTSTRQLQRLCVCFALDRGLWVQCAPDSPSPDANWCICRCDRTDFGLHCHQDGQHRHLDLDCRKHPQRRGALRHPLHLSDRKPQMGAFGLHLAAIHLRRDKLVQLDTRSFQLCGSQ